MKVINKIDTTHPKGTKVFHKNKHGYFGTYIVESSQNSNGKTLLTFKHEEYKLMIELHFKYKLRYFNDTRRLDNDICYCIIRYHDKVITLLGV